METHKGPPYITFIRYLGYNKKLTAMEKLIDQFHGQILIF